MNLSIQKFKLIFWQFYEWKTQINILNILNIISNFKVTQGQKIEFIVSFQNNGKYFNLILKMFLLFIYIYLINVFNI